ncbi:serologically defined colon cancer antigen 8 homolog isoform X1 [Leptidea sinapis]|uniref:serologically defined colon cancer antigen 8 homolog isoform X1 n=1 Tax=Leptidea sinapis TaxID=189913 RepID=UPI0021C31033|nr:serologically defined colon cancer antigen 8 homolog isoform X1 [Leptidea sinapis]
MFSYRRPARMNEYGLKIIPDYTDLAYKEAVSKLKYFLSGNNAPSIRSYGGSASIKNLDESDIEDKKYLDFKPRPRLTTKYTTLYADSLNNYVPPKVSVNPPAAVPNADLTGGTNPDVVHFIQKQEEYIEQLERESQYCREELNNLLGKVKEVISENEHLHEAQKNKLISRMFHTYNAGSETDELDDAADSTGLDSDNKGSPSKSRRSGHSRVTKLEGPNIVFESRISELEAQLTQSKIDLKKLQEENNECKRKLASGLVDSTCLDGFKRQIDNLQRDKSSLESQIAKLKLSLDNKDDDGRYKRSDVIEQQLRDERNNLELEIRRLKDDLAAERNKVRELAGETARRAQQERNAAEHRYNQHFDDLQHDLAAQYDNVAKLQLELERQRREENELKRELSMKNAALEEIKMELKNKTASLQADLAQAHAEKASLEEELASARLAMERQQRQAKHESNRLSSEIQSVRQRLDRADADLVHSRRENLRLAEQISNLEKELNMKSLTPMTPEKKKKEKELSSMLESMENKHAKTVAELECMIQSQNSLMEKLTSECRLLTDKLDDANRRHKQELGTLQRQVDNLGRSLQTTHAQPITQAPPTHATTASRIPNTMSRTGSDDTRTEPPRNSTLAANGNNINGKNGTRELNKDYNTNKSNNKPLPIRMEKTRPNDEYKNENSIESRNSNMLSQLPRDVIGSPEQQNTEDAKPNNDAKQIEEMDSDKKVEIHEKEYEAQNYSQDKNYDQNYEQNQPTTEFQTTSEYQTESDYHPTTEVIPDSEYNPDTEYQPNSEYQTTTEYNQPDYQQQEYEQQQYSDQQYENYEQYPQYSDPNAHVEGIDQYENYTEDNNYTQQNYDTTQYNQDNLPQYAENTKEAPEINGSNKNMDPSKEKISS